MEWAPPSLSIQEKVMDRKLGKEPQKFNELPAHVRPNFFGWPSFVIIGRA